MHCLPLSLFAKQNVLIFFVIKKMFWTFFRPSNSAAPRMHISSKQQSSGLRGLGGRGPVSPQDWKYHGFLEKSSCEWVDRQDVSRILILPRRGRPDCWDLKYLSLLIPVITEWLSRGKCLFYQLRINESDAFFTGITWHWTFYQDLFRKELSYYRATSLKPVFRIHIH